jgi:hypothetical protein
MNDNLATNDYMQAQLAPGEVLIKRSYVVIAQSGLYKYGKLYLTGTIIELDDNTAANFIAARDIKELST